jgi:hypothetical protein
MSAKIPVVAGGHWSAPVERSQGAVGVNPTSFTT